jgi:hypothetical protein
VSRRSERIEQARKRRRQHRLLIIGGSVLALIVIVVAIALAGPSLSPTITAAELPRISPEETYELMQTGEAVLYDVRSEGAYAALHAEGSLSLPEGQAVQALDELPRDRLLVFL